MSKSILIITNPMPYSKIGSWTTMYNYYLHNTKHQFDYIICPMPDVDLLNTVEYSFVKPISFFSKLKVKFKVEHRLQNYFSALDKIIKPNEKYVIQIVDNSGLVVPLNKHVNSHYLRDNFYIQYYYHGFSPIILNPTETLFYNGINEILFLTKMSYVVFLRYYNDFVCNASILHNATNSKQFFKLEKASKEAQKKEMGYSSKLIFIWCSQDRPKKGLDLLLKVWKKIYLKYNKDIELLIVGTTRAIDVEGVKVVGRIPNNELAKYYQISDFYLFPTLCKEGFGISLAEALKCGCYCIASDQGGVPEVLEFGKLGQLIENPNFIGEWVDAIERGIEEYKSNNYENPFFKYIKDDLYDIDTWSVRMNALIIDAKLSLEK